MINILRSGLKDMFNDLKNRKYKKQIANLLTFSRFFSPFVLLPLFYLKKYNIFLIMIVFFFLTDTFDGYFARKYKSTSLFGRYLDACVDKMFALTLLIPVLNRNIVIILIIELFISSINLYSYFKKFHPKTIFIGKVKTFFLFIMIGLFYLNKFIVVNNYLLETMYVLTLIFQLITFCLYIFTIKKNKFAS